MRRLEDRLDHDLRGADHDFQLLAVQDLLDQFLVDEGLRDAALREVVRDLREALFQVLDEVLRLELLLDHDVRGEVLRDADFRNVLGDLRDVLFHVRDEVLRTADFRGEDLRAVLLRARLLLDVLLLADRVPVLNLRALPDLRDLVARFVLDQDLAGLRPEVLRVRDLEAHLPVRRVPLRLLELLVAIEIDSWVSRRGCPPPFPACLLAAAWCFASAGRRGRRTMRRSPADTQSDRIIRRGR